MFTRLYENRDDNFGNGRDVRNCFEDMIVRQSNRVAAMESPTREDLMAVLPEDLKVPHMGWNTLTNTNSDLFKGFDKEEFVYFVHSFYVPLNEFTAATTDYILPYSSALHKDNFYATQFHPEKSGAVGERILRNFIEL